MVRGKPRQFPLDYNQTKAKIQEYKTLYEQNKLDIPSVPGFCAFIGTDIGKFVDTINNPVETNNNLAEILKGLGTWCDSLAINSAPAPVARVILAQGFGGYRYTDKQETRQDVTVNVQFGGSCKDPFG